MAVQPPIDQAHDADVILDRIIHHIDEFAVKGEHVDFDILKDTLRSAGTSSHDAAPPIVNYLLKSKPVFSAGVTESDPEKLVRGLLLAFQYTPSFKDAFEKIDSPDLLELIRQFMAGRSITEVLSAADGPVGCWGARADSTPAEPSGDALPLIYEDSERTKKMQVWCDDFENWGLTVKTDPVMTFMPTTVVGIQNLVKYAIQHDRRVRCAGFRHSWSYMYAGTNDILVSFVSRREATHVPNCISFQPDEFNKPEGSELKRIELLGKDDLSADGKRLCKVGVAITNEDFRRWAVQNNTHVLPVDVILIEATVGGVNAAICHGAGLRHQTVSDLVERINYVDCNGVCQEVRDPEQIKAAAGCFGLLGVVTHVTLRLDEMSYAQMLPVKEDIVTAIPPPQVKDVPGDLMNGSWLEKTHPSKVAAKLAQAQTAFERRAVGDYYSEWCWFTYQREAWVNTWNTVKEEAGAEEYPKMPSVALQWLQGWLGNVMSQCWLFQAIPDNWKATLIGMASMSVLPNAGKDIKTSLPNALHFRRCIQNMRVRDMEFEIPLPPSAEDPNKPDLSVAQRAWWDVINIVYSYQKGCPMRLCMEMRIMGDSDILMAPQYGNGKAGTASIEVLTVEDCTGPGDEWKEFTQRVADAWMKYGYQAADGSKKQPRPHWAKEWKGLTLNEQPAVQFLRDDAYKLQISEFKRVMGSIGMEHKWTLEDLRERFSNTLWDEMLWTEPEPHEKQSYEF